MESVQLLASLDVTINIMRGTVSLSPSPLDRLLYATDDYVLWCPICTHYCYQRAPINMLFRYMKQASSGRLMGIMAEKRAPTRHHCTD